MDSGIFTPLLFSILLYLFIVTSNFLEHTGITSCFDPFEDIAEIVFTLVFLFFVYNWRKQQSFEIIGNQETWLRSTLESIADGIITTDREGRVLQMNKTMEEYTGWLQKEASGLQANEILSFLDKNLKEPVSYDPFQNALKLNRESGFPQGILLRARHGQTTLVADSTSAIISPKNEILGAVGIFRDMSRYESLIEQLTHTHKMEAIGQLAGGVAHDLNNMLGGIIGAADLIRTRLSKECVHDYDRMIDIILNSAKNAADLTANLLAFSRRGKILSTPISIQDVIHATIALAERTIDKRILLKADCPSENLMIIGDPSQLQNALLNLVLNARDAIPGSGTIVIEARKEYLNEEWCSASSLETAPGEYIRISVQDDGQGIPAENQDRIFEPFFTTKAEGKGTGLGLSAVYGTVVNHHGTITMNSKPGEGTKFSLYFPVSYSDFIQRETGKYEPHHGRGTILLIEDEEMLRSSTKMILEDSGYNTILASCGEDGITLFMENRNDITIVLLDMIMPGMNGREVYSKLRDIDPKIPVIMTSGFTNEKNIPEGVACFLKKPYNLNELLTSIQKARK